MRVVLLGPFPPPHGGVETNVVAIRDYLRCHGHSCSVLNITRHRKPEEDGVFYPRNAAELARHLYSRRYDVVHLHVGGIMPNRVIALALLCASVPWAKSVFTLHSGGFPSSDEGRTTTRNSFRAFSLRRFDAVIGVNREMVDFFGGLGVARGKAHLILPHAVIASAMAPHLPQSMQGFFASHSRVLVAVCQLENEYQIPFQIAAMPRILEAFPNTGLAVLGSGSRETEIRDAIAASPARDHILLCGDVPHAVTLRAIDSAAALLRTTLYDGDAISVREALHLGTPVVASDNGMRPPGLHLFPIGDEDRYVRAVKECLTTAQKGLPRETDESNIAAVVDLYGKLLR